MLKSRVLLMVVSGLLGGCVGFGGTTGKIEDLAQGSVTTGGTTNTATKVAMQGTVKVPSSLVANNANALVGNNANALVGNNANALVANNANALVRPVADFGIQALDEEAVEGMPVAAYDAAGDRVSDVATTDKDGKFELSVPTGSPLLVGAIAPAAKIRELAIGYPGSTVKITAGSTFAAFKVWDAKLLAKAGKAEVSSLANAFGAVLKAGDLEALRGSDADLKAKVAALVAATPAIMAAAANLLASDSGSGASSGGSSSDGSGSGGSGGTSARTKGSVTVDSWPIGASFKVSPASGFSYVKADPGNVHSHNSPTIKSGDIVRFTLIVDDLALSGGGVNTYLKLIGSDSAELAKLGVSTYALSSLPACGTGYNAASCKTVPGAFATFNLTVSGDVKGLEFGGDLNAQLTQIDVNPDLD